MLYLPEILPLPGVTISIFARSIAERLGDFIFWNTGNFAPIILIIVLIQVLDCANKSVVCDTVREGDKGDTRTVGHAAARALHGQGAERGTHSRGRGKSKGKVAAGSFPR